MYFSYVPSIIFSFFNHPLFLNLLFKQILIQYYSILFNRVLTADLIFPAGEAAELFVINERETIEANECDCNRLM